MFNLSDLQGKVAVVTGANRGIGQAIALTLGQMGATVIGTGINNDAVASISKDLEKNDIKGFGALLDITAPQQVQELVNKINKDTGTIQILVNNAGITQDTLILRMKDEQWEDTIETNLTGAFYLCKACVKSMIKSRWGRIISIGSVVGFMGNAGQVNYSASKAGLLGLSKSLAKEVGPRGVTVNVVAPGFIETKMTENLNTQQREALLGQLPLGRLGSPSDIANVVAFLASEQASYITGETIHVNGGMYM